MWPSCDHPRWQLHVEGRSQGGGRLGAQRTHNKAHSPPLCSDCSLVRCPSARDAPPAHSLLPIKLLRSLMCIAYCATSLAVGGTWGCCGKVSLTSFTFALPCPMKLGLCGSVTFPLCLMSNSLFNTAFDCSTWARWSSAFGQPRCLLLVHESYLGSHPVKTKPSLIAGRSARILGSEVRCVVASRIAVTPPSSRMCLNAHSSCLRIANELEVPRPGTPIFHCACLTSESF